jgi:hypothetical protein
MPKSWNGSSQSSSATRSVLMLNCSMKRVFGLVCVVAAGAIVGGCSSVPTYPTVHTANTVNTPVRESTRVAEGQTLTVRLAREEGMINGWRLSSECFDNGKLQLISRTQQQSVAGGLAGVGEQAADVFTFSAVDEGFVTLTFVCDQLVSAGDRRAAGMWLDVNVFNARAEARAAAEAQKAAEEAAEAEAHAIAAAQREWE